MGRAGVVAVALIALIGGSAGCERQSAPDKAAGDAARPTLDAEQRLVYERSCATCHGRPGTGAPAAGDTAAWAPRVEQGLPALLDHTINGYGGMPPMGLCMECGQDQLIAFIEYMAGVECDENGPVTGK